jgi:hypothetical protein
MNIYASFLGICAPCLWNFLRGRLQWIVITTPCEHMIIYSLFNKNQISNNIGGCKEKYHSELTGDLAICYLK